MQISSPFICFAVATAAAFYGFYSPLLKKRGEKKILETINKWQRQRKGKKTFQFNFRHSLVRNFNETDWWCLFSVMGILMEEWMVFSHTMGFSL